VVSVYMVEGLVVTKVSREISNGSPVFFFVGRSP